MQSGQLSTVPYYFHNSSLNNNLSCNIKIPIKLILFVDKNHHQILPKLFTSLKPTIGAHGYLHTFGLRWSSSLASPTLLLPHLKDWGQSCLLSQPALCNARQAFYQMSFSPRARAFTVAGLAEGLRTLPNAKTACSLSKTCMFPSHLFSFNFNKLCFRSSFTGPVWICSRLSQRNVMSLFPGLPTNYLFIECWSWKNQTHHLVQLSEKP